MKGLGFPDERQGKAIGHIVLEGGSHYSAIWHMEFRLKAPYNGEKPPFCRGRKPKHLLKLFQ
ncbi:hypothetical protein DC522_18005 [Microvirga sp. KLBC 81]|uniref:hypothetical protein n=1 Tax=Microvirga sp. KLBC 81 TaxID=1862707 RepID=UPI000D51D5BB|nr:hypothetical protein [Microvirga sp. KLBC 81]PVE22991.1 hypothetical protein DC522_18005 [Microvirga sp. KLBC 81]